MSNHAATGGAPLEESMIEQPRQIGWRDGDPPAELLTREWLVTNALGGYASGTIGGACTRRFHGQLIAALPAPLGRIMMFNHIEETITDSSGRCLRLSGDEHGDAEARYPEPGLLREFRLDNGLPVWLFQTDGLALEKRLVMPHRQNTTYITYQLLQGRDDIVLQLRPSFHFRAHEGLVSDPVPASWDVRSDGRKLEIAASEKYPSLRILFLGGGASLERSERVFEHVLYRIEKNRGYEFEGPLWSPGVIRIPLLRSEPAGLVASTESWEVLEALAADQAMAAENERLAKLLRIAAPEANGSHFGAQLVLAADQFIIVPKSRPADTAIARATGDDPRTVIAGYHWFTDWGRDTMISLEGLTLATGRYREAGSILRMFASYIKDGLIPNMFPEGEFGGLYHTADATMWFFHAVDRYVRATDDRSTLRTLLPKLVDIIDHHLAGTHFGIGVDHADGLLTQGAEGYQLTWMDAKVDGWVVTPRRGKAVEINALFYNALSVLEHYLSEEKQEGQAARMHDLAARAGQSFNRRFWYEKGQYLYDVVDGPDGDENHIRPNQLFAISLPYPVLEPSRWDAVLRIVEEKLLTPVGLRSLAPGDPDYKGYYDGDLRVRDAAYHQGTVWGWLIGPFIDAWLKLHPGENEGARHFLDGFPAHMAGEACIGSISEVFDATAPFTARGCVAQAWSVAEVLRCLVKVGGDRKSEK
jgi:predicted glycogen debranching enzyme